MRLETELGTQTKIKAGGRGFLSFSDPRVLFGVGTGNAEPYRLTVHWPSGLKESYDVRAGDSVLVTENEGMELVEEKPFELSDPQTASERILRTLNLEQGAPFPALAGVAVMGDSGRRTLVNIWATWCVPCSVEMPELERAYPALQAAGIDLIGLSVDTAPEGVPGYLEAKGITYPNFVVAEDDFSKIFKGDALTVPLTVLLDEAGLRGRGVFGLERRHPRQDRPTNEARLAKRAALTLPLPHRPPGERAWVRGMFSGCHTPIWPGSRPTSSHPESCGGRPHPALLRLATLSRSREGE